MWVPAVSGAMAAAGSSTAADVADLVERAFCRRAIVFTIEYSMNAPKTKTRHVAIQTSMALVNDPAGIDLNRPLL